MNENRKTGWIVGGLFLVSYAGVFVAAAILGSTLEEPIRLADIAAGESRVTTGLLVELINDAAVIGIAVMLYPLLRRVSQGLALWYIGFRVIEAAMFGVAKVSALALVPLSQDFVGAGSPAASSFDQLAAFAIDQRDWAGELASIAFMAGAVILYVLLYRSELVPRFISVWGLLAVASLIAARLTGVPDLTQEFEPAMLLYFPIVANELFLAGWLIVKGLRPSADMVAPPQARTEELVVG